MATTQVAVQPASPAEAVQPLDRIRRLDWGMALLSIWIVCGFYVDLWRMRTARSTTRS
jgi:hypothetical protein